MKKDRALYYLKRHLRGLEFMAKPVDHAALAKRGVSYGERQAAEVEAEARSEASRNEREAYEEIIALVEAQKE